MNAEPNALKDALDGQREHVLEILDGLSEQDLRRPALPTVTWLGETPTQASRMAPLGFRTKVVRDNRRSR